MHNYIENKPIYELFGIHPECYADTSIFSLPFSVRTLNRLRLNNINTLKELVLVDIAYLKSLHGFGVKCVNEVISYCNGLIIANGDSYSAHHTELSELFVENREAIALGDFSFVDPIELNVEQKLQFDRLKAAYDDLGEDLSLECICSPQTIMSIISALSEFFIRIDRLAGLRSAYYQIPEKRRQKTAKHYIDAFSSDEDVRSKLKQCYSSSDDQLGAIITTIEHGDEAAIALATRFLSFCSYDLASEVQRLFDTVYSSERVRTVIEGRANHQTLNELGGQLGITRERVRQIELKAKSVFARYQARNKIMSKLWAEQNGQIIVTLEDVELISGEHADALIYLLKEAKGSNYTYDDRIDAFLFGDTDLSSRIQDYIDTLPDVIFKKDILEILTTAQEDYDLDNAYVEKALLDSYSITGDVYHRSRLTLATIYDIVLRKYYSSGIHIYDETEMEGFRQHIYADYGRINLPNSNRAIAARISSICILSGRGVYIPKKDGLISDGLAVRILSFIIENDSPIVFIGNIFSVFEDELKSEGIDNRYYLQGILHELYCDRLYFRRDYVSKDKGLTSFYSSIVSFIRDSDYPVKKNELKMRFKGVTDIVISLATSDIDILNFFGEYLHGSKLIVRETEKEFLSSYLSSVLADGEPHHIKDVYAEIINARPELFSRNAVLASYSAFSVLEYLFRDQYQFSRPYIALNGVEIGRSSERLHELLYSMDRFSISTIKEFAAENHMQINVLIDYIDSINDKYLMVDSENVASIEEIGIDDSIAHKIETIICEEIDGSSAIRNLTCIQRFPSIKMQWNEWLIYSVLKKWGTRLDVALSSSQLRQSIPIVSFIGNMDVSKFKTTTRQASVKIDNMDDIDDLLADILTDDLLEGIE